MSKQELHHLLTNVIQELTTEAQYSQPVSIQIETTKDKQFGDFATNIALTLAKPLQLKPRELAELIIKKIPPNTLIEKIEIAGPGFINFFLNRAAIYNLIPEILKKKNEFGKANIGNHKKVLVEFVSSNPTGPLHVGHGRHAAYGACVSNLLETVGYDVSREYYVNDAGRQMDILAVSVWLRYLDCTGEKIPFPANAYKGEYVIDIAKNLFAREGNVFTAKEEAILSDLPADEPQGGDKEIYIDALIARMKALLGEEDYSIILEYALDTILTDIREDLKEFGVTFQTWFSEREFVQTDAVNENIHALKTKGLLYEREGALWFRATDFDDEKDRVLERANGQRTYFANDFAYHVNKFERGFDHAIDIFGSDHHGYIPRMKAALTARGIDPQQLTYLLVQFVSLYRGDVQLPMSTRSGSFVTLRELRNEVGNDAARFFYVMRKYEQPMDFDLELAKSQSNENPVYYVQYAHARICSVFRQLGEKNLTYQPIRDVAEFTVLSEPSELQLLKTLSRYCDVILTAATNYEPHSLTNYLRELAADFHGYYNSCQFLVDDEQLRNSRLSLIAAVKQILLNGLNLIGVSAPESM